MFEFLQVPDSMPIDHDWKSNNNLGDPVELFYFRGNKHHQMSILVADVACIEEVHDNEDNHSETTSCDISSHCSTCLSGRSLTESQPGNIYQLLSLIEDNEENLSENGRKKQQLLRGSGDSDIDSDFLTHKRMRLNSGTSYRNKQTDEKSLNPNMADLENDASFWDDMGNGAGLNYGHQWRSAVNTPSEDSLCHSGCHNYRSDSVENLNNLANSAKDSSSETSLCLACKKAKLVYNQMLHDLNKDNVDGRTASAIARPSRSDMTVSSASGFSADSGSVSITGLSLGSNSDFYLPSSSCYTQTDESYFEQNSGFSNKAGSDVDSNSRSWENSIGHLSCDKYYNTGSYSGASTERGILSSDDASGRSIGRSLASADGGGGGRLESQVMSDSENRHFCVNSDGFQSNKSIQTEHSWTAVCVEDITNKYTTVHPNPSSSTLIAESASTETTKSQTFFSDLSRSCSNRLGDFKKYVCFVSGAHDAIVVQEVKVDKLDTIEERLARDKEDRCVIARDPRDHDKKDHYFFIKNCYITGMCLSHDQR